MIPRHRVSSKVCIFRNPQYLRVPFVRHIRVLAMSDASAKTADNSEWDAHAADYAKLMKDGPMMTPIRAMLKQMDAALPFSQASAIADVGCGPGSAISELLDAYQNKISPDARLVASDFSQGMVEQVRQLQAKHKGESLWDKLETYVWDLQNLDHVPSESYSHVMGSLVFFFLNDPRQALSGVRRILVDDGLIALTSWSKVEWMEMLEAASQAVRPDLAAGRKSFKLPESWASTEGVKGELEAVGFTKVQVEYVETWLPVSDPSILLRWFIGSKNPGVSSLVQGFSEEDLEKVCAEFVRLVDEKCPSEPKRLRGIALAATGRK